MSESVERRIDRLGSRIAARGSPAEQREAAATSRFYADCASWADYELLGSHLVDGWRADLFAKLPLAAVRPVSTVNRFTCVPIPDLVVSVVTAPTGRALTPQQLILTENINTLWSEATDLSHRLFWAGCRLTLGTDGGLALRTRCWRVVGDAPVLGEEVLSAAHGTSLRGGHLVGDIVGHRTLGELADKVIGSRIDERFSAYAERLRQRGTSRYLSVSVLEAAILLAGTPEPAWLGAGGKSWWLGHIRSEQVNEKADAVSTADLLTEAVLQRATRALVQEDREPKPWRTEAWHARRRAAKAGWEVEREYLLEESRQQEARRSVLPDP